MDFFPKINLIDLYGIDFLIDSHVFCDFFVESINKKHELKVSVEELVNDLREYYKAFPESYITNRNIEEIFLSLESNNLIPRMKTDILDIMQLYFESLFSQKKSTSFLSFFNKRANIDDLFLINDDPVYHSVINTALNIVSSYWRGQPLDSFSIDNIVNYKEQIINFVGLEKETHTHYINNTDYRYMQSFVAGLQQNFENASIDTIIGVLSGGVEPALMAADLFELDLDSLLFLRYSHYKMYDTSVVLSEKISEQDYIRNIKNKNVLIVDDWISQGNTLEKTANYVLQQGVKNVYFATVKTNDEILMYSTGEIINSGPLSIEIMNSFEPFCCRVSYIE